MANDKWIEEIAGKLKEHSSEVNPQMWQGISSQIAAGSGSVAGGLGFAKIAGIVSVAVATVAITYFAVNSSDNDSKEQQSTVEIADTASVDEKKAFDNKESKNIDAPLKSNSEAKRSQKKEVLTENTVEGIHEESHTVMKNGEIETPLAPLPLLEKKKSALQKDTEEPIHKSSVNKTVETSKDAEIVADKKKLETVSNEVNKEVINDYTIENQASIGKFVKLPNVFTPNNDGVNDYFFVESVGLENYVLVVLDGKNNVVWKTNIPDERWDGRNLGGEKLPVGSYIYFITATDKNGKNMNTHQRLEIQ